MQVFVRLPWPGGILTVETSPFDTLASLRAMVASRVPCFTTDDVRLSLGGRELSRGGAMDVTLMQLRVTRGATLEAHGRLRGGMPIVKGAPKKKSNEDEGAEWASKAAAVPVVKKRDKRSAFTRFAERLPVWWEELNENNTSLYVFSERSRFRRSVWRLIKWPWFDRVVMFAILLNCVFLAMYDPMSPPNSSWNLMLDSAEYFFTAIFTIECALQIIARNFIIGPGAYMNNPWYVLDFVIVVTGLLSVVLLLMGTEGGNLSGMRTLRAMKPLKTINGVPGMRILVNSILDSMPLIKDIMVLLIWLFFIFGIVGMDLFSGKLHARCFAPGGTVMILEEVNLPCSPSPGGNGRLCGVHEVCRETGVNPNHGFTSFDNIAYACLTIVQTLTRRGWTGVMEQLEAATGDAVTVNLYFTSLVMIGSVFAMSIITAVVIATFQKTAIMEGKTGSSADNKARKAFFRRLNRKPTYIRLKRFFMSRWGYQRPLRALVTHDRFARFITGCIVLNTATMAIEYHGMDPDILNTLDLCNMVLTLVFFLEMVLKIAGLGIVEYFGDRFNWFDAFIAIVGVIELASSSSSMSVLRAFRLMRVLRSLKILRSYKRMRVLMEKIGAGLSSVIDFLLVLALFLFIFSVLGMQLFGGSSAFHGSRKNFDNLWDSFLVIFEMLTASDWYVVMWRAMEGAGPIASVYFMLWIFIGHYILLDLFLAILVYNFSCESSDEQLERLEQERIQQEMLYGGEKLRLDKVNGANMLVERIIRRKNRNFAKEAAMMRTWLRETDQSYGRDDFDYDSEEDEARAGAAGAGDQQEDDIDLDELANMGREELKRDEGDHDDADDGRAEDAFSINRTDARSELLNTLTLGVAVPVSSDQVTQAEQKTVKLHGARRPLDKFRNVVKQVVIPSTRLAGDGWRSGGDAAGRHHEVMSSRLDMTGMTETQIEDALLREDEEKKKKIRRQKSLLTRLMATKSAKKLQDDEDAKRAAAAAAAGGKGSAAGQQGFEEEDLLLDPHANEDILNDIVNDTLMRAEASGTLTAEGLAKQMGWDVKDMALSQVKEEDLDDDEYMSQYTDDYDDRFRGGGDNVGPGGNIYASNAAAYGFGALAAAANAGAAVAATEPLRSVADLTSAAAAELGQDYDDEGVPLPPSTPLRDAVIAQQRQATTAVGAYQGSPMHPAIAAQLKSLGLRSGATPVHPKAAGMAVNAAMSPLSRTQPLDPSREPAAHGHGRATAISMKAASAARASKKKAAERAPGRRRRGLVGVNAEDAHEAVGSGGEAEASGGAARTSTARARGHAPAHANSVALRTSQASQRSDGPLRMRAAGASLDDDSDDDDAASSVSRSSVSGSQRATSDGGWSASEDGGAGSDALDLGDPRKSLVDVWMGPEAAVAMTAAVPEARPALPAYGVQARRSRPVRLSTVLQMVAAGAPPDGGAALIPEWGAERATMGRRGDPGGGLGGVPPPTLAEQLAALGTRRAEDDEAVAAAGPGPVTESWQARGTAREMNGHGGGRLRRNGLFTFSLRRFGFLRAAPFPDAADEEGSRPGPVTEGFGGGGGELEASLADRMAAARARGISRQQNDEGGEVAQGRAFATLMSAGAAYGVARARSVEGVDVGAFAGGTGMDGFHGDRDHHVTETHFGFNGGPSYGDGLGFGNDAGQVDMATGQSITSTGTLGMDTVAKMAAGQSKTHDLARDMMQRLEARRLKKLMIQPIVHSDAMAPPMTEDFALPHIGVVVRGGAARKKKMDGVPDRDVIVNNPAKLKQRPKHKIQKVAQQKISGGDPPPVYMKHRSLFMFSPNNSFRRVVFMTVFDKKFEYLILLIILVSSIALAIDDPSVSPDSQLGQSLSALDVSINVIFFVEAAAKVVAMGLFAHPGAYLRHGWNVLDGFIVLASILFILVQDTRLSIVRSFRMMRALRPLRMIKRLRGMQLVVATLVQTMPQIMNIILFGVFQFVVFGILGVQLFGGRFWRCTDPSVGHLIECKGTFESMAGVATERKWVNSVFNFDNIFQAMLSLFVVVTMDKWFDLAHRGMDVTEVNYQPVKDSNPLNALFFIAFIIIAGFFWVNLLIGAIIDNYRRISAASGDMVFTTAGQKRWAEALKMKLKQNQEKAEMVRVEPKFFIRKYIFRLVHHRYFEIFIMFCIFVNIFIMLLQHDEQPDSLTNVSNTLGSLFTGIFIVELLLKVTALLPKGYWKDPWNRFDFFIVLGSIPEIFGADMGPGATVFRTFRMGRMFKMLRNAKGLRALFVTMIKSAGALANVGSLLFLLMFIFAVLGMNLFGKLPHGEAINDRNNFQNFGNSMSLLFRIFSGDAWSQIMVDTLDCDLVEGFAGGDHATGCAFAIAPPLYFVSFIMIASFMLLNLFVAVILDHFVDSAQAEGLLSTASFFDAFQRKMLLEGFMTQLKARLEEHRARLGLKSRGMKSR